MSRFTYSVGWNDEDAAFRAAAWERNSRLALKGKRGRRALAELRDALLALPGKRLIDSALCTIGGVDKRLPAMTDAEMAAKEARVAALGPYRGLGPDWPRRYAEMGRRGREVEREKLAEIVGREGEGVCAIGAYLWHRKVKAGMDPAEAFDALPTVFGSEDEGDPLEETAALGRDAGLTFTLAWELAYRNDETYRDKTPEERYTAFLAWIEAELAEAAGSLS